MRIGVRREMQPCVAHLEPVGLHGDRLFAFQQPHDGVHRLQHARTLRAGFDAEHVGVGGQRARPAAHHRPAARHVVELHEALRHHERMMIRQAGHAGAEFDVLGAFGGGGDDQFGQGDQFPAGGVMLADPGFVVAQPVQPLEQLDIAVDRQRRVFPDPMERCQEDAELHAAMGHVPVLHVSCRRPHVQRPPPVAKPGSSAYPPRSRLPFRPCGRHARQRGYAEHVIARGCTLDLDRTAA